ncbi:hypothetical protein [Nocardiopsis quinghaiensis]|uniref:hypothetical protein n=1 Tax=Nocardiopsis quinghaiensis TaxID=464995 RepID=UPI0012388621|nr:hypothetical protein [Nocardiopsis quinghaiensis]
MHPTSPLALRFPLLARSRPACVPLGERVDALCRLADTARETEDQSKAASVFNQAALLASDAGMPELARTWCHQHASARLASPPLSGLGAIHALEPLVNLARLHIRGGDGRSALRLLEALFEAVSSRADVAVDGLRVPGGLAADGDALDEVRSWLRRVLLADGVHALTVDGHWQDALDHLRRYDGVGERMWDGRQVAVIASATSGDHRHALRLVRETVPGEPWENAVTAALAVVCRRGEADEDEVLRMLDGYRELVWEERTAVFHTRLGLTVADVLGEEGADRAHGLVADLARQVLASLNGYCARELLRARPVLPADARDGLSEVVSSCGLGPGGMPTHARQRVDTALGSLVRLLGQGA